MHASFIRLAVRLARIAWFFPPIFDANCSLFPVIVYRANNNNSSSTEIKGDTPKGLTTGVTSIHTEVPQHGTRVIVHRRCRWYNPHGKRPNRSDNNDDGQTDRRTEELLNVVGCWLLLLLPPNVATDSLLSLLLMLLTWCVRGITCSPPHRNHGWLSGNKPHAFLLPVPE